MPRIKPVELDQVEPEVAATLKAVKAKLGMLPNMFATMAQAPVVLTGYLQLSEALSKGRLNARQRELIAIAVAQENQCEYCLSAHAAIGKGAGLNDSDIESARHGEAANDTNFAILRLALRIVRTRANLQDQDLEAARKAGLDDAQINEVVANVALNVLTNYINRVAGTEVDFPLLALDNAA